MSSSGGFLDTFDCHRSSDKNIGHVGNTGIETNQLAYFLYEEV